MKKVLFLLLIMALLSGCTKKGWGRVVDFQYPDIKNDYCGVVMNFQYCKCAFHNEYCEAIGMDKKGADNYVRTEYQKWLDTKLADWQNNCQNEGGIFDKDKCRYCDEGYQAQDGACVDADQIASEFRPEGPLNSDCTIKNEEFDRDWKKYSDIDEAIAFEERSYEAKEALIVYETMLAKMTEAFALERDIEIEKQMQTELANYRTALVNNIKTNLLKSFWRLSWTTYSTIKGAKGLGESFSEVLTSAEGIEALGKGLKVVQGVIPNDSVLAIDTSSISGKVKSVGAATSLEALSSLGDPLSVATSFVESSINTVMPSADLTEEEIDILKNQHLEKGLLDEVLSDSRQANTDRESRLLILEKEISELQTKVGEWEAKEKDRVKFNLEDSCQMQKRDFEDKG